MSPILGVVASGISGNLAAPSFDSISTTTITSPQSTLVLDSIPGTYKHLQIRGIVKATAITGGTPRFYFNGNRTESYSMHEIYGSGGTAGANQTSGNDSVYSSYGSQTTAQFGGYIINIYDYANTSKSKTVEVLVGYDSNSSGYVASQTGMWTSTAAIYSIAITPQQVANWDVNSTWAVYGIKG